MTDLPEAPYLKQRRRNRHYYLLRAHGVRLQTEGRLWLEKAGGIVVYKALSVKATDLLVPRVWVAPRVTTMHWVGGVYSAPESFTYDHKEYIAWDWLTLPAKKVHDDPFINAALFMRAHFGWLKMGDRSKRTRVYDLWPQPGQKGPIWKHEPHWLKTN